MTSNPADVVVPFVRPTSVLSVQLKESVEAYDLAPFIYRTDQRLGRADMAVDYDRLTAEGQQPYIRRAAIAIRLGDDVKAIAVGEHAALGMIRDVTGRMTRHELGAADPETAIDLAGWRRLAKVSVLNALEYLGSVPRKVGV